MIGLRSLEVDNSIFNVTEEINKFELYIYLDSEKGELTYEKVKERIEKHLEISDIVATDLQDVLSVQSFMKKIEKKFQKE